MTSDVFRPDFQSNTFDGVAAAAKSRIRPILTLIGYVCVFLGYMIIFLISLFTVGFLEIRQANMNDFNALIAVLDQRDRYKVDPVDKGLPEFSKRRQDHRTWVDSLGDNCLKFLPKQGDHGAVASNSEICDKIKETLYRHANELWLTEDEVRFKAVNLEFWYQQFRDGITQKTPHIIPTLKLLESELLFGIVKALSRSPFELIQMFLLVCMGMLGGVISVMRCFVDPSLKNPAIAEFFYKPAAGAAISLGVYVLFRAAQIFLGVQSQGAATVSTSVFLLAGLGLASGFCATQALATIESVATRLLRASGGEAKNGEAAGTPRGTAPDREGGPSSARPAASAATPG